MATAAAIADFYASQFPLMAPSMVLLLLPYVALERWRPVSEPPRWRDYAHNLGIGLSTLAVAAPFGIAAAHASAAIRAVAPWPTVDFTFSDIGLGIGWLDPLLAVVAMILMPLLIHDLWFYWSHRLEHHWRWLWRFHQLHHSDPAMNASTFGRDHFMQTIWRGFFSMFTLGLFVDLELRQAEQAAVLSSLVLVLLAQFYHAAVRIELRWLDRVVVTPQVHRIHHSIEAQHRDKNFADVFPWLDILFGTYCQPRPGEFPRTGVNGFPPPSSWWRAQLAPLSNRLQS